MTAIRANAARRRESNILEFRQKTYSAKPFQFSAGDLEFKLSGTLDGLIDLAITEASGKSRTYNLEPFEARQLADRLCATASDVQTNCLYERDALLV